MQIIYLQFGQGVALKPEQSNEGHFYNESKYPVMLFLVLFQFLRFSGICLVANKQMYIYTIITRLRINNQNAYIYQGETQAERLEQLQISQSYLFCGLLFSHVVRLFYLMANLINRDCKHVSLTLLLKFPQFSRNEKFRQLIDYHDFSNTHL